MSSVGAYSTASVPPEYLGALFLTGQTPLKASSYDPRISYALYVPPEHYNPNPTAADRSAHPSLKRAPLPLLIAIHGTKRDATGLLTRLTPFADSQPCAVLTPLFPAGLDDPLDLDSYKDLKSKTLRSDLALLAILNEVSVRWPGIRTERFSMIGFSGGGQFVQRFLYLHPARLNAVSIGAPGRVTSLDPEREWPKGIKDVEKLFGLVVDVETIQQVKIQLVVGADDNIVHGNEAFWEWLRTASSHEAGHTNPGNAEDIRVGRLETLKTLHAQWKTQGIEAQLDIVRAVAHESAGVQSVVLEFIDRFLDEKLLILELLAKRHRVPAI